MLDVIRAIRIEESSQEQTLITVDWKRLNNCQCSVTSSEVKDTKMVHEKWWKVRSKEVGRDEVRDGG